MQGILEREGLKHIYFDGKLDKYSNVGLGLLARAAGFDLKVAYFNSKKSIFDLTFLFRNVDLENVGFYDYMSFNFNFFKDFDLLIFDDCSFLRFEKEEILKFFSNLGDSFQTEIVFVCSDESEFDEIKDEFDLISKYNYEENENGRKEFVNISGNGKGKSTFCFGFLIRKLIDNKKLKLIYFDKGGCNYGEKKFFDKVVKKVSGLEIVSTGTERFDGKKFRFENKEDDFDEAKKGLDLVEQTRQDRILVLDELNTTVNSGLLKIDDIIEVLSCLDNDVLVSGRNAPLEVLELCCLQIDVEEVKHYCKEGGGVRKGIDY